MNKNKFIKVAIMTVTSIFIALSIICALIPNIFVVKGIKSKELSEARKEAIHCIDDTKDLILKNQFFEDNYKDEFEDVGLDMRKSKVRKFSSKTTSAVRRFMDGKVNAGDLHSGAMYGVKLASVLKKVIQLDDEDVFMVRDSIHLYNEYPDIKDAVEEYGGLSFLLLLIPVSMYIFVIFGILAIVFTMLEKGNVFHITFFVNELIYFIISIVVSIVGTGMLSEIEDVSDNARLSLTAAPFLSFVFALIALVFKILFVKKKVVEAKSTITNEENLAKDTNER